LKENSERHIFHPQPQLMSRLLKLHRAIGQLAHDTPDTLQVPDWPLVSAFLAVGMGGPSQPPSLRCWAASPRGFFALKCPAFSRRSQSQR
jgi:hypothetical protein